MSETLFVKAWCATEELKVGVTAIGEDCPNDAGHGATVSVPA